jgi:hypothetical protein
MANTMSIMELAKPLDATPESNLEGKIAASENKDVVLAVSGASSDETPLSTQHLRFTIAGKRLQVLVFS